MHRPVAEARHETSRLSLEILRLFTIGLWFTFPIVWMMVKTGVVDIETEEWLWCTGVCHGGAGLGEGEETRAWVGGCAMGIVPFRRVWCQLAPPLPPSAGGG
jgi:hypothetical protein